MDTTKTSEQVAQERAQAEAAGREKTVAEQAAAAERLVQKGRQAEEAEARKLAESKDPNRVKPRPGETEESAAFRGQEKQRQQSLDPHQAADAMGLVYVIRSMVGEYQVIAGRELRPWAKLELRHSEVGRGFVETLKQLQKERKVQVGTVLGAVTAEEARLAGLINKELQVDPDDADDHSKHGDVEGAQMQAAAAGMSGAGAGGEPKTIDGKTPKDPQAAVGNPTK